MMSEDGALPDEPPRPDDRRAIGSLAEAAPGAAYPGGEARLEHARGLGLLPFSSNVLVSFCARA